MGNGDCSVIESKFKFFDRLQGESSLIGEIGQGYRIL